MKKNYKSTSDITGNNSVKNMKTKKKNAVASKFKITS